MQRDHRGFCQDDFQELFDDKLSLNHWHGTVYPRQAVFGKHRSWDLHLQRLEKLARKLLHKQAGA